MAQEKKQSFLHGAIILMAGTLVVKIVSVLFKVPITNMLSESAMSYFETAYTFFNLFSTLATAGFPIAISKIIAENGVEGRYRDTRKILKISLTFFSVTGLLGTLIMFLGASPFAGLIKNPGATFSVMCLSPAVLFLCMMSAYRGYYQGLRNMYPTANSQIIEAVVKMMCGVGFTRLALSATQKELAEKGTVLGKAYATAAEAEHAIYQISAGAALVGVVVSTAVGLLYLSLRHHIRGDGIDRHQLAHSPEPRPTKKTLRYMVHLAIPICLGSVAINLTSMIDIATVMDRLSHVMENAPEVVLSQYKGSIPTDMANKLVPAHLYGAYTSIAVTIANIIPAVSAGFGVSALPMVSNAWARRSKREVQKSIQTVLRITALFCIPAGIGLSMLAKPVCQLFFNKPMGIAIAAPLLQVLGIASIFISLTSALNSLLQAIGCVSVPVRLIIFGGIVKLIINFMFVGIPGINMKAVPYGTLACYIVIVLLSLYVIKVVTRVEMNLRQIVIKPLIAAVACGIAAVLAYDFIFTFWPTKYAVLPAVGIGAVVYGVGVLMLRALKKEDVLMLPKGEKVAKILEKCSLLG